MIKQQTKSSGKIAEKFAADYLAKQGLALVSKNVHSRFGEIDLVMLDVDVLVFVEVRYRQDEKYMAVIETVNWKKCKKILMTSEYFLQRHKKYQKFQCRYDLVTIHGQINSPLIKWIKNAFQA